MLSYRGIIPPLSLPLAFAAQRWLNQFRFAGATQVSQAAEKLNAGPLYHKLAYAWAFDDGTPHDPSNLSHRFLHFLRDNKLPVIRFHDLRHTHAAILLMEHVPVKIISKRLVHSSSLITQDLYSHVLPEMQQEAANAMERALAVSPPHADEAKTSPPGEILKFRQTKLPTRKKKKNAGKSTTKKSAQSGDHGNKRIQKSS